MQFSDDGVWSAREDAPIWTLVATGDCCPIGRIEPAFASGEVERILGEDIPRLLRGASCALTNLETPMCEADTPIPKTGPNFRVSPEVVGGLEAAGFDVVALANNHILDQGEQGLADTLRLLDASGIARHGAGMTHEEASRTLTQTLAGQRIAFVNLAEGEFSQCQEEGAGAARLDPVPNTQQIEAANAAHDIVIVSVHSGNEYVPFPSPRTQQTYREFIDAGADVVIGHHPHMPQGIERYRDGVIFYSLGNFLFDYATHQDHPYTAVSFLAEIGFDRLGAARVQVHPYRKHEDASLSLMDASDTRQFVGYLNQVNAGTADTERLRMLWEQEAIELFESTYRGQIEASGDLFAADEETRYRTAYSHYNLWRCDAHYEALKTAFRLMYERRFARDEEAFAHITGLKETLAALVPAP